MKKNYIINERTYYIREKDDHLYINELGEEFENKEERLKNILETSCLFYGSTLKGRKEGTKNLINEVYKLPIIINDAKLLIIFPLVSLRSDKSIWLVYNNIKEYHQINKSKVLVTFKNNSTTIIKVSYYRFHMQILKCSRLEVVKNSRNMSYTL